MNDTLTILILAFGFFVLFNELRAIRNRIDASAAMMDELLEEMGDTYAEDEHDLV